MEVLEYRLRYCHDRLNCVKMAASQFYLSSGTQRQVGWVWDDSHVILVNNSLVKKGSVRWCFVVFVANFRGEVFAKFHTVAVKFTLVLGIYCLVCRYEFFVRKIMSMLLTLLVTVPPFSVSVLGHSVHGACLLERLSNHCQSLFCTFPTFSRNSTHNRRMHHEIASGQINDSK
jgi:hypothetical protein